MQEILVRFLGQEDPRKRDRLLTLVFLGFPGGLDSKESACNVGNLGLIPGLGRCPGGGCGNLLQYSCLGNSHGQRSLGATCSWGHKGSDTTEWLSTAQRVLDTNTLPHGLMFINIYLFSDLTIWLSDVYFPSMHSLWCPYPILFLTFIL